MEASGISGAEISDSTTTELVNAGIVPCGGTKSQEIRCRLINPSLGDLRGTKIHLRAFGAILYVNKYKPIIVWFRTQAA